MTNKHRLSTTLAGAAMVALLSGCGGGGSGGNIFGETYDLISYLFPEKSGVFTYQVWKSSLPKDGQEYTEPQYSTDQSANFGLAGSDIEEKRDGGAYASYSYDGSKIQVHKIDDNLTYHMQQKVNDSNNFVQENPIKQYTNSEGTVEVTYSCNIIEHLTEYKVEPRTFADVLHIECTNKKTLYVTLDSKKFENTTEVKETIYAVKNKGVVNDITTTCEYSKIGDHAQTNDGCKKVERKYSGFAPL